MKQSWDVSRYEASHQYVWNYGASLVELLAPQPGERILDLGCGAGQLTDQIASAGAIVHGIDSSPAMIAQARINFPHLTFALASATGYHGEQPYDAVFSNAVLHWVKPPESAAATIASALKPGGRFVAEFGGAGNVASILDAFRTVLGTDVADARNPWYYPTIGEYATLLERHGLEVVNAVLFPRPTPLLGDDGLMDWLQMFCAPFAAGPEVLRQVEEILRPVLYREGTWFVDYRRLRVVARKAAPKASPQ